MLLEITFSEHLTSRHSSKLLDYNEKQQQQKNLFGVQEKRILKRGIKSLLSLDFCHHLVMPEKKETKVIFLTYSRKKDVH